MKGNLDIGETGITTTSNFQAAASTYANEGFLATDWIYTKFIEANDERDANSTGISLGADTGFTDAADDTILLITGSAVRLKIDNTATEVTGNLVPEADNTRN